MIRWLSILLIPLLAVGIALADVNLTTNDDWQSTIQSLPTFTTTVNLAAGTYQCTNTHLYITNAGTILNGAGASSTFILAATTSRVIYANATNIQIKNLTISGGNPTDYGGGVRGHGKTLVDSCTIASNTAAYGGGLYGCDAINSLICSNRATNKFVLRTDAGGGISFQFAGQYASNCVVSNNTAADQWAGICSALVDGGPWVKDSIICDNTAARDGGGIAYCYATNCQILRNKGGSNSGGGCYEGWYYNCTIRSNWAGNGGGGWRAIYKDCDISYNWAGGNGGGLYHGWATNCTITFNVASNYGGGLYQGSVYGCTVANNQAANGYGGIFGSVAAYCYIVSNRTTGASKNGGGAGGSCTIYSSVFRDNYATGAGHDSHNDAIYNCTFQNTNAPCLVGWASRLIANSLIINTQTNLAGTTNVAANYFTAAAPFMAGTYIPASPNTNIIDAGNNTYANNGSATYTLDYLGRNRTVDGDASGDPAAGTDIGAVEYQPDVDKPPSSARKRMWMFLGD